MKKEFLPDIGSPRVIFIVWFLAVACFGGLLLGQLRHGPTVETNLLALLPQTEKDPVIEHSLHMFSKNVSRKAVFLISHQEKKQAKAAADIFYRVLQENKEWFSSFVFKPDIDKQARFADFYYPYRRQLLSQRQRRLLQQGQAEQIKREAVQFLYSPLAPANSDLLKNDPLFLFFGFMLQLPHFATSLQYDGEVLFVEDMGRHYVLVSAQLLHDPFSIEAQQHLAGIFARAGEAVLERHPQAAILAGGVILHAIAGTNSAKRQMSTIGTGSLIGIFLLILISFRSAVPLVLSLLSIATGCLVGFVVCIMVFGKVHMLTLVFGATLTGISIDYSFHYFTDHLRGGRSWTASACLRRIFPGITLGMVTSVIAYVGMLLSPFPGLRQMALFSSAGLLAAYATVICWFPLLLCNPAPEKRLPLFITGAVKRVLRFRKATAPMKYAKYVWLLLIITIAGGLSNLKTNDDIRLLQNSPLHLRHQEERIRELVGHGGAGQFFIVEGNTEQETLEHEELLAERLQALVEEGVLSSYQALSSQFPSLSRQKENYRLLRARLIDERPVLETYMAELGFAQDDIDRYLDGFSPEKLRFPAFAEWLRNPVSQPYRHLWAGAVERGFASMVTLGQFSQPALLKEVAAKLPQVSFIDQVDNISSLFKRYRELSLLLISLSYLLIFFLLIIRYSFKRALVIMAPPLLAAVMTLSLLGYLGETLNLFNTLALLLVLGIGIDYTLFLEEAKRHRATVMLAITLSAMTTLLSFGLLALSNTPVLHSFGLTVLMGIAFACLLSPVTIGYRVKSAGMKKTGNI
ncbi:MAG: MMPL family transporter [Gammaproteobacteria bacterium]|nr:MMPL family transporter [Gammaproteobacteria bacterium]